MLVEKLSETIRTVLDRIRTDGLNSESETGFIKLLELLEPYARVGVDDFFVMLSKVKKPKAPGKPRAPKKSAEELAAAQAEKDRKLAEKEQAKTRKEAEARAKADAKAQAALAKKAAAEVAALAKAAAKLRAEEEKNEKKARKAAEDQAKLEALDRAVRSVIDDLNALLMRFRDGNVPKAAVDEQLDKLKPLKADQLLRIAQALNSDATLTEKSPKAKILKQLTEMVRRVWKTSDNVNH